MTVQKFRIALLATTAIGIILVLIKSIVNPVSRNPQIAEFAFPETVPLPKWQLVATDAVNPHLVKPPTYISGEFVSGKHYRYSRNGTTIDIEMRYFANTNGDLKSFITHQTGQLSPVLRQQDRGVYALFSHQEKAYLSACINPSGGSTVTSDRFNRNRLLYDPHWQRIVPWFLGEKGLQDRRCLWAHLSVAIADGDSIDSAYQTLETVWFSWYDRWNLHFPIEHY